MRIYVMNTELLRDEALREQLLQTCSAQRREKILRMRNEQAIRSGLAASALLDLALQRHGLREKNAVYEYGASGKPAIPALHDFHFSISHSGNTAALAVSAQPVGMDVQQSREISDQLLRRWFSEQERTASDPIRLWTLKESYGKYTGEGIAVLARTEVLLGEEIVILRDGVPQPVCFREFYLKNGCFLATCCHQIPSISIEMIEVNRSDFF